MTEPTMTPAEAYDRARAAELARHTYRTDHETLTAKCSCGTTAAVHDVGNHILEQAEQAGIAARDAVSS